MRKDDEEDINRMKEEEKRRVMNGQRKRENIKVGNDTTR